MIDSKAREILQQPAIVRISTITPDGYPHSVPVWFILDGDDLVVFTGRENKKVKNIQANPKGSIAFGGDPVGSPCYLVMGEFVVEEDPEWVWTKKITYHYESKEKAEEFLASWAGLDFVVLRLKPRRVIKV